MAAWAAAWETWTFRSDSPLYIWKPRALLRGFFVFGLGVFGWPLLRGWRGFLGAGREMVVVKLFIGLFSFAMCLLPVSVVAESVAASDRGKAMDAIVQRFESLGSLSDDARLAQTIQFARTLKEVRYATVTSSGDVGCVFKDGVPYVLQVSSLRDSMLGTAFQFAGERSAGLPAARNVELPLLAELHTSGPELPASNRAMLVGRSSECRKSFAQLENLLSSHGYVAESIYAPTVGQIARLGQAGIVYLDVDAVLSPSIDGDVPMFATGDRWSAISERKIFAHGKPGQIGWLETYCPNRIPGEQRVAIVSQGFLEESWNCNVGRLVVLVGQNSPMIADRLAGGVLGRSTFCAFVPQADEEVPIAARSFLARALGARDPHKSGDSNESPDRPFEVKAIADDMSRDYFSASLVGGADAFTFGMPYVSRYGRSAGIVAVPSIKHAVAVGNTRDVDIEGTFGPDPGPSKRSVTLRGVAITIKKWTPAKITIELPTSPTSPTDVYQASGELTVVHTGRRSNSRWLSTWNGVIKIGITGEGTLSLEATFMFNLITDPWPYRESPGAQPKPPMVLNFVNVMGTTCDWRASGEHRGEDGTLLTGWAGAGRPRVWIDVPAILSNGQLTLPSRRGTFAVGATALTASKILNLNPGMLEDMDLNQGGNVEKVPVKLGDFLDGQTIIQPRFDAAFKVAKRVERITDQPDKLSYGGLNGTMESSEMVCNSPMPPNAPR